MEALDRLAHGILVTDQSGRIMLANCAAEAILAEADGIGSGRSGLFTAITAQTSELRRMIAQAAGVACRKAVGGALTLDRPSLKRSYQVLVSPLRAEIGWAAMAWQAPAVLVLIIDPEKGSRDVAARLRALFGLTRAEARVAQEISAGEGLVSVAEALGTHPTTIRTHLHRVFSKTDTRRQAELVKLVERVGIFASEEP